MRLPSPGELSAVAKPPGADLGTMRAARPRWVLLWGSVLAACVVASVGADIDRPLVVVAAGLLARKVAASLLAIFPGVPRPWRRALVAAAIVAGLDLGLFLAAGGPSRILARWHDRPAAVVARAMRDWREGIAVVGPQGLPIAPELEGSVISWRILSTSPPARWPWDRIRDGTLRCRVLRRSADGKVLEETWDLDAGVIFSGVACGSFGCRWIEGRGICAATRVSGAPAAGAPRIRKRGA